MSTLIKVKNLINIKYKYYSILFKKFLNRFKNEAHQLTHTTKFDRYPDIFNIIANLKETDKKSIKILSFGCSSGEECLTINKYFPYAEIVGVDISKSLLQKAKNNTKHLNTKFLLSYKENIEQNGPYDIILCMSVLCRWEDSKDLKNITDLYPFHKFQSTLTDLDENLKPGGIFVIYNSNFRFTDSSLAKKYEVIESNSIKESGFVNKFDKENILLRDQHYAHCIFKKK